MRKFQAIGSSGGLRSTAAMIHAAEPWRLVLAAALALLLSACSEDRATEISSGDMLAEPTDAGVPEDTPGGEVTIIRDEYGVPHVFADTEYDLYFGYGYAVAQDRLFQMEMLRRTTSGTVAEVLGPDYLELDVEVRNGFLPQSIRDQYANLPTERHAVYEGYAAGFNAWIDEVEANPGALMPIEFNEHGFAPQRWEAYDVLLIVAGGMMHRYSDFNEEMTNLRFLQDLVALHGAEKAWQIFNALLPLYDVDSVVTVPVVETGLPDLTNPPMPPYLADMANTEPSPRIVLGEDGLIHDVPDHGARATLIAEQLLASGLPGPAGFPTTSNAWLANGDKVSDADAVLVNGPQFGWSTPSYVYGIGLHGPDFDLVGNTLLAYPMMLFTHNGTVGWGSTAGFGDQVDIFQLELNPEDSEQYRYHGEWRDLEQRTENIAVKGEPDVEQVFYRSVYGPVIEMDAEQGVAYSKKRSWEGREVASIDAWVRLSGVQDFTEFRQLLSNMAANINLYYVDASGNIGYNLAGAYPVRHEDHDNRLPALGNGDMDWQGYRPFDENPHTYNPEQGYIMNWNNRSAANWPNSDLWWRRWSEADRADVLVRELEAKASLTAEELWEINSRSSYADLNRATMLSLLTDAFAAGEDADEAVSVALGLLQDWDGLWTDSDGDGNFDSPAMLIMDQWLRTIAQEVLLDDIGDDNFPRFAAPGYPNQPILAAVTVSAGIKAIVYAARRLQNDDALAYDFFNGDDYRAVFRSTFQDSIRQLIASEGADMSQWRLGPSPFRFRISNFRGVPQTVPRYEQSLPVIQNRGSENNIFVARNGELDGGDVVAPGQSGFISPQGQPSPHFSDQLNLYNEFGRKSLPFTRAAVEGRASDITVLATGVN